MNKIEKATVLITLSLVVIYIIAFNLNIPHYWKDEPRVVSESALNTLLFFGFLFSIATLVLIIKDIGKRNLENINFWVAYVLFFGVFGIPHYYFKIGRFSRNEKI